MKAIRDSGVRFVVALTSLGADLSEGTGLIAGLHAQEERLKQLKGANVLLLRRVSFFQNFYDVLGLIKHEGINGTQSRQTSPSRWLRPVTSPASLRRRSRPATAKV